MIVTQYGYSKIRKVVHEGCSFIYRGIPPNVFLGKGFLKICSKFTPMSKGYFNKVANTFFTEHPRATASTFTKLKQFR